MKSIRVCITLASSLLFATGLSAQTKRHALLIGVNNYEGTGLSSLNHTVRDMEALKEHLGKAGFQADILANSQATKANIEAAIRRLKDRRATGELVLIAMSGHGVQMPNAKGEEDAFYCPAGCDKSDVNTLLSLSSLVKSLGSKGVNLVLVDACRDDPRKGFKGIVGNTMNEVPANTAVLFSCSAGQQSFETNRMFPQDPSKGHGVFFYHVLRGLEGAAKDGEGEVTWDTLVSYVKKNVDAKVKEWFDDRAKQLARDRGVAIAALKMQTPHQLANLQDSPVLSPKASGSTGVVTKPPLSATPPGFTALCNGVDLKGWESNSGKLSEWRIDKGVVSSTAQGAGWLVTERDYANFELRLEFKLAEKGNSGVALRYPMQGDPAYVGMEIQLLDDTSFPGQKPVQYSGSIYGVVPASKRVVRPAGQWNEMHIICNGRTVRCEMNGSSIVNANLDNYRQMFQVHPGLTRKTGRIGLDGSRGNVEFRNVFIKVLK